MQSADDVKLGHSLGVSGGGRLKCFLERHGVGAGRVLLAAEGAETAGGYTNICWIDVPVDIEIRAVAVHPFPDVIREPADGKNIAGAVEIDSVCGIEPLPCHHLIENGLKARVVSLEWMQSGHCIHHIK